jgi:hypothetical protein
LQNFQHCRHNIVHDFETFADRKTGRPPAADDLKWLAAAGSSVMDDQGGKTPAGRRPWLDCVISLARWQHGGNWRASTRIPIGDGAPRRPAAELAGRPLAAGVTILMSAAPIAPIARSTAGCRRYAPPAPPILRLADRRTWTPSKLGSQDAASTMTRSGRRLTDKLIS